MIDTRTTWVMECDGDCDRTIETEDGHAELVAKATALGWRVHLYVFSRIEDHYCPEHAL